MAKNRKRNTFVKEVWSDHHEPNDPAHPRNLGECDITSEVWVVYFQLATGTMPPTDRKYIFRSEDEAEKFKRMFPVYSNWTNIVPDAASEVNFGGFRSEINGTIKDSKFLIDASSKSLADEVLLDCGLADGPIDAGEIVVKSLGLEKVNDLRRKFSKKWGAVAIFEYCRYRFGPESREFIAANYKFQMEVAEDYFAAGYLLRDLEFICLGVEHRVWTAIATDKKAGKGGGNSRKEKRSKRLLQLLAELERIRFKTIRGRTANKDRMVVWAVDRLVKRSTVWDEGEGQVDQYLREMKDGTLGKELQARYFAVFPSEDIEKARIYVEQPKLKR